MQNPYGAVPQALENSRLALRDIMADYLATKTMDANMNLMMKKAETENAMVGANLERDRLTGERQDQRFQAEYDLRQAEARQRAFESKRTFEEGQRQFDINKKLQEKRDAQAAYAQKIQLRSITPTPFGEVLRQHLPMIPKEDHQAIAEKIGINLNQSVIPQEMERYAPHIYPIMKEIAFAKYKSNIALYDKETDPHKKQQYGQLAARAVTQLRGIENELEELRKIKPEKLIPAWQKDVADRVFDGTLYEYYDQKIGKPLEAVSQAEQLHKELAAKMQGGNRGLKSVTTQDADNAIKSLEAINMSAQDEALARQYIKKLKSDPAKLVDWINRMKPVFEKMHGNQSSTATKTNAPVATASIDPRYYNTTF